MTQITAPEFVAQANALLNYIKKNTIPYRAGGMSLTGMDCQGAYEYCLIQGGVPQSECNLAGSNAHYRACSWAGTPEECKELIGAIPAGAVLFILENDGREPDKYKADGIGNASHMGIWTGKQSLAASAGKGRVIASNFKGKSINGGWNRVGLSPWIAYGLTEERQALLAAAGATAGSFTLAASSESFTPYYSHLRFQKGDMGGGTREIQAALNRLGYALAVDGQFGPLTHEAVLGFQRSHELEADGVVGEYTWGALIDAVNTAAQS